MAQQRAKQSPHITVLVENTEFLHGHLEDKINDLLPRLAQDDYVLTERRKDRIARQPENYDKMTTFLGIMRMLKADTFVRFLEVLRIIALTKSEDTNMSDSARACLDRLVSGLEGASLSDLTPDSEAVYNKLQSEFSKVKSEITAHQTKPLDLFYEFPAETVIITKCNTEYYSPKHGVYFTFNSLPVHYDEFEIKLIVCDPSLFEFSEEYELCTAIIKLNTFPSEVPFTNLSISIPHCAIINSLSDVSRLSILSFPDPTERELKFSDGEEIKADFGDGICAHFIVNHFTIFAGVKRKQFTGPSLNTREHSQQLPLIKLLEHKSIEKVMLTSFKRVEGDFYWNTICCLPPVRVGSFNFVIAVYKSLPTFEQRALKVAAKLCGCSEIDLQWESYPLKLLRESALEFVVNKTIDLCSWEIHPSKIVEKLYSSFQAYKFSCSSTNSRLNFSSYVNVKWSDSDQSVMHSFSVDSNAPDSSWMSSDYTHLGIHKDIFGDDSHLLLLIQKYIQTGQVCNHDVILDVISTKEHYQFISYVCFNMGNRWRNVGQALNIEDTKLNRFDANCGPCSSEKAFEMLYDWATSDRTDHLASTLLTAFRKCKFILYTDCSKDHELNNILELFGSSQILRYNLLKLSCTNIVNWKFLGRYLGVEHNELTKIECKDEPLSEMTYQMMLKAAEKSAVSYQRLGRALFLLNRLCSDVAGAIHEFKGLLKEQSLNRTLRSD